MYVKRSNNSLSNFSAKHTLCVPLTAYVSFSSNPSILLKYACIYKHAMIFYHLIYIPSFQINIWKQWKLRLLYTITVPFPNYICTNCGIYWTILFLSIHTAHCLRYVLDLNIYFYTQHIVYEFQMRFLFNQTCLSIECIAKWCLISQYVTITLSKAVKQNDRSLV